MSYFSRMHLMDGLAFPIAFVGTIRAGMEILPGLLINVPWAIWQALGGRIDAKAIGFHLAGPLLWLIGFAVALAGWGAIWPAGLKAFWANPTTVWGLVLGAAWVAVGAFARVTRREMAAERTKSLQVFGKT